MVLYQVHNMLWPFVRAVNMLLWLNLFTTVMRLTE